MTNENLSPSMKRQQWLDSCFSALVGLFSQNGHAVPEKIRFSFGIPKASGGAKKHTIGQCWDTKASADGHFEIFISPELGKAIQIFDVMAHEICHAVAGIKAGHKAPFKRVAESIGLTGKMTATTGSDAFNAWAAEQVARMGEYPAAPMSLFTLKKQTTRLLKCSCEECGYTARVTRKWVEASGTPVCPTDKISMACDAVDEEDSD